MIDYPRQDWMAITFAWRGTVLPRIAPRVLGYCVLSAGVAWGATQFPELPALKPLPHSLVGIALGMLLVFRTNASYDRYWEGRKQWGGIVNASRNLVRAGAAYTGSTDGLWQLVAAYPLALKQHLRTAPDLSELRGLCADALVDRAATLGNPPLAVTAAITEWIAARVASGSLAPETARGLDAAVNALLDHQGACERILKTPVPFAYVVHIRQLLTVYLVSLPLVLSPEIGVWSPLAMAFIAFGLLGIEEAGVEIEDPFGTDPNDLPLDALCATIRRDVTPG
jgi:ion channel-forming bestrophin family protein